MKFTNTTDQVVWFKRTHRFGEEPAIVIGVAPGESLPTSQVHRFEPTAPLPGDLPPAEIEILGKVETVPAPPAGDTLTVEDLNRAMEALSDNAQPPADPASNDAPPQV